MLILTSNGFTSNKLINECMEIFHQRQIEKALIITTASLENKANDYHIPALTKILDQLNITFEYFDYDQDELNKLNKYDMLIFISGNPFYLCKSIKTVSGEKQLKEYEKEHLIIGIGNTSLAFQKRLDLINEYDPYLKKDANVDFNDGLGLINLNLVVQYKINETRYNQFEDIIKHFEIEKNLKIVKLNEGEAIIIEGNNKKVVNT